MQFKPVLELKIPEIPSNVVEGLAWYRKRLFSVGSNGKLVEWDILTGSIVRSVYGTGSVLWCIDINPNESELAIGSDEGYINIFDIGHKKLQYKKVYTRETDRVLCCRYSPSGEYLVTGSVGFITVWNTITSTAIRKILIKTIKTKRKNTIYLNLVWTLQVMSDLTIAVGDSNGYLSLIDGNTGAYLEVVQAMYADILSIAITEDENFLICAGVDPTIRIYKKNIIRQEDFEVTRWVLFLKRSPHQHDVKALALIGTRLLSGGATGYLIECSIEKSNSDYDCFEPLLHVSIEKS